ncbi:MAG: hypothetical protein JSU82_14555 [Rhodospirillales bacterium]|nr:MAG: hypothetical protein JSU82_14555 [Rhodospirillales bacterium]
MRKMRLVMGSLVGLALLSGPSAAQDAIGKAFSETLFEEETISASVREHPDVSGLSKAEMNRVLQARDVVREFFQRLSAPSAGNVVELLDPAMAARYGDRMALRRDRFGAERYLSFEIFDFRISDDANEVKFRYFLGENDRGRTTVRQRALTLRDAGGRWLIAEFDNFDFD